MQKSKKSGLKMICQCHSIELNWLPILRPVFTIFPWIRFNRMSQRCLSCSFLSFCNKCGVCAFVRANFFGSLAISLVPSLRPAGPVASERIRSKTADFYITSIKEYEPSAKSIYIVYKFEASGVAAREMHQILFRAPKSLKLS